MNVELPSLQAEAMEHVWFMIDLAMRQAMNGIPWESLITLAKTELSSLQAGAVKYVWFTIDVVRAVIGILWESLITLVRTELSNLQVGCTY